MKKRILSILLTVCLLFSTSAFSLQSYAAAESTAPTEKLLIEESLALAPRAAAVKGTNSVFRSPAAAPAIYDPRESDSVTHIKDAGTRNISWAYAAVGALESYLLKNGLDSSSYSENFYNYRTAENAFGDAVNPSHTRRQLDSFGYNTWTLSKIPLNQMTNWVGPVPDSDFSDLITGPIAPADLEIPAAWHVQSYTELPKYKFTSEDDGIIPLAVQTARVAEIKSLVQETGAVITATIDPDKTSFAKPSTYSSYTPNTSDGYIYPDLYVDIIGWDDTFPKTSFKVTAPADGAFIVKASKGSEWYDQGYFYISYYDRYLADTKGFAITSVESASNYDRIYTNTHAEVDSTLGFLAPDKSYASSVYTANVYPVVQAPITQNQFIKAVGLTTAQYDTAYEIYVNPNNSTLSSASLLLVASGTIANPGYTTVEFDEVLISALAQKFAVVVKYAVAADRVAVPIESTDITPAIPVNAGESFRNVSGLDGTWGDLYTSTPKTHFTFKAFTYNQDIPVTGVSVNKTSITLQRNEEAIITATVVPENAANKNILWTSSNSAVATVDANGIVTARGVGSAVITVSTVDGNFTATTNINVGPILAKGVTFLPEGAEHVDVVLGDTLTLDWSLLPADADNQNVSFESDDTAIATVSSTGLVEGLELGSTTVTITTAEGNHTATITVNVVPVPIPESDIILNKRNVTLVVGGTDTLIATVLPAESTFKTVAWSSDNEAIATVDSHGKITATGLGVATITASTVNGHTVTARVFVGDATSPVIKVEKGVLGRPNQEISVTVSVDNNPGVVNTRFSVSFDTTKLQLLSVEDKGLFGDSAFLSSPNYASPYVLFWNDSLATVDYTANGAIATLKFKVLGGASLGETPISVSYLIGDIHNTAADPVPFLTQNGSVIVQSVLLGDVDGDGEITLKDATLLARWLANWPGDISQAAADIDGDGEITGLDLTLLNRFLAGWDIPQLANQ
ncbi:MAG: Ig-like domain-containing protein [Oscillospiraceae bacterium]|jgi:uncharacterized protein YjdB/C1A family cysteine protease|nr:Ig-like domain-containing protein [Oscillospiraceae bacterium]